jgi:hypothetical protein
MEGGWRSLAQRTETQRGRGNSLVERSASVGVAITPGFADGVEASAQADAVTALMRRLNRLTQEVSQARQRNEQLQAVLEKRTRRVQQLIGERDRLTSLLSARDAELQRLNRELGALSARVEPAQVRSPTLFAAARTLLDGLRNARNSSRRAKPAALRTHQADARVDGTRLVPWIKHRPPKDVFAVVVFGLSVAEIERVLEAVERYCAEHDAAPLLLTDNDSFQPFRNRRVVFEFLPSRSEQQRLAPELDWQLFTLRRLALIRCKWRPVRVVPFGRRAAELVQRWRDSAFEETPLPTPLNNRSAGAELPESALLSAASLQR